MLVDQMEAEQLDEAEMQPELGLHDKMFEQAEAQQLVSEEVVEEL
jgi:hypothetical protein